ncbi:multidrug resistance efflux pump PmrA [Legionella lansingensis]|uniref:Multidrug resistance efflux pump PmrA n=1 Tax=Legionella lansingensis TaxID=45067 RepID=A0A0W0VIZ9_9GAMM|nr:HlyD family secretion protein [Legionella lansingensis]KTD20072.1 multidrug resistance efflux pump PmrA [Legionella lansingensis]SNV51040.1 multidrug resistance efflux pump PmrA [Legionella lansingensis]
MLTRYSWIQYKEKLQVLRQKIKNTKRYLTFPNVVISVGLLTLLIYTFSYLFPFTDNAFVVNNIRPVAAQVQGYITTIYVKNGQRVLKGQKLFTVFKKNYQYIVDQLTADLEAAKAQLKALKTIYDKHQKLSENHRRIYEKLAQDYEKYRKGYRIKSVSLITLENTQQEALAAKDKWEASLKQLDIDKHQIEAQRSHIQSIQSQLNIAHVNLAFTDVCAQVDGIVQNLFLAPGAPVNINQPLFSLVSTDDIFIQANFNETDLRDVREGSNVLIFPRMYLGRKMFHGVVTSNFWAANRQQIDPRTQLQNVSNENQWILLPQRLPVIIRVIDPDPQFPLRVGASAYVYITAR